MQAKILEIFSSIQGEGKYAGAKQVFVRFFECNMHCVWCDTPHSIGDTTRRYKEYSLKELIKEVELLSRGCHSVSLTGGEPLLQKGFIKEFLSHIKRMKLLSYLDTNGTLPQALKDIVEDVDIIAMDLKLPTSTKQKAFWKEHEQFLKIALKKDVFIKAVISSDTKEKDILKARELVRHIDPHLLFILQPNFFEIKNGAIQRCLEFQNICAKELKNVRIMPQVHKFMKLR